jgi:4-cresol dehydrogenase (hydroxylating) flavoprotein subunit
MNDPISDYQLNITEFSPRNIHQVWKPKNLSELKEILLEANRISTPVHPISTGHNWGLGSKLPVTDCNIIDLGHINQILEVNEDLCYARIQPGVTQKQLADHLRVHFPNLILNVTGSDANSSILGNTIERGSGKNGHRATDLRELKVLLANGEEISTGFGGNSEVSESFYKYGLGADLTHLFTQSNFGIVTEGVINLMIRQPFTLFLTRTKHSLLSEFLENFSYLVRTQVVGNSLELDSQNDPKIFELFEDKGNSDQKEWIGWFAIYGEKNIREAKKSALVQKIDSVTTSIKYFDSENSNKDCPLPVKVRLERYAGTPSDHSLLATAKSFGIDLNEDKIDVDFYKQLPGFRCVLPVVPFSKAGAGIIDFIIDFSNKMAFDPAISIIGLDAYSLEVFARVFMNRNDQDQIDKAAEWSIALLFALKKQNIFPYRLDIETMIPYLASLSDSSAKWKAEIKQLFDPNNIISPQRYHLISYT